MASSPSVLEGVFAINKPPALSSAQVIRDAQVHFKSSKLFQPWLEREQALKDGESHNQKRKRRSWKQRQPLQVKMGHGGTLDPMATGVLVLGVGSGTKSLSQFHECTKSYETVVLLGAATDSYDSVGKITARKPFDHVTREAVEQALKKFRGKIMQRPPIFSALWVQGKRLYEYAREGKEVPVEIVERPVEVESLDLVEWMDGGTHEWHWPIEEAGSPEKAVVERALELDRPPADDDKAEKVDAGAGPKRKRGESMDEIVESAESPSLKRPKSSPLTQENEACPSNPSSEQKDEAAPTSAPERQDQDPCPAPACRLRMTVTSGFYVRSLCHDLGTALDSLGIMVSLVRTRQGDFELGHNVMEYEDLAQGEEVWGGKVSHMLKEWREKHAEKSENQIKERKAMRMSERRNSSSSSG